jgi:hypothetical protein
MFLDLSSQGSIMVDTFDFCAGILLGTFLGSLATLVYHIRQIRQEVRQNYIWLSLAQAEVETLERTLEIHRRSSTLDPMQLAPQERAAPQSKFLNALPLTPAWIGNSEAASGTASRRTASKVGES